MNQLLLWVGSSLAPGSLSPLLIDASGASHGVRVGIAVAALEHPRSGVAVIIRVAS